MSARHLPLACVVAALAVVPRAPAVSATITIGAGCTLTDAIKAANDNLASGSCPAGAGADVIQLAGDVTLTVVDNVTDGPNALPSITSDITIEGGGFEVRRSAAPGTAAFRIFHVAGGGTLRLHDLTVANGFLTPALSQLRGGGIRNSSGTLMLTGCRVVGNRANTGGGIYQSNGTVTLYRSTLSGNSAFNEGGGIHQDEGDLTLTDSTVSGNSALTGGGFGNHFGEVTIGNSTLSANSARHGGGIRNYVGTVTLTNSTLSGNSASLTGGGILTFLPNVTLTNTIVANSTSGGNCDGGVINAGNNLSDDATCGTIPATLTGLEPDLLDNGGPTMTHALAAGSNARDAGSAADCPPADQRGGVRVSTCDIGAFEVIPCADLVLANEAFSGTETRDNCHTIAVGPTVSVTSTGELTLRAGKAVALADTTSVDPGGQLAIELAPDLQLSFPTAAFECVVIGGPNRRVDCTFTGTTRCFGADFPGFPPPTFDWSAVPQEMNPVAEAPLVNGATSATFELDFPVEYSISLTVADGCGSDQRSLTVDLAP